MVDGIKVLVVLVEVWSGSSPRFHGVIGGADTLRILTLISARKRKERMKMPRCFYVGLLEFEGDWEIESFGSWLRYLPQYLPRLGA